MTKKNNETQTSKKDMILNMTPEERAGIAKKAIAARVEIMNRPENVKIAKRAAAKIAHGQRITVEEFECLTGVMFSHKLSDKMKDILAISTNCLLNDRCIKRILSGKGICSKCFAANLSVCYESAFNNTAYNASILYNQVLPLEHLPIIDADELRIEWGGDTGSWMAAANYMNLARVNPLVSVTAWTKNPDHYLEAIRRGYTKPDNFTLILSSFELNEPQTVGTKYAPIIDKRFTVYTLEWLDNMNLDGSYINCGARSCKNCQRCYKNANKTGFDVRELLKKDAKKAEKRGGSWDKYAEESPANDYTLSADAENIFMMYR